MAPVLFGVVRGWSEGTWPRPHEAGGVRPVQEVRLWFLNIAPPRRAGRWRVVGLDRFQRLSSVQWTPAARRDSTASGRRTFLLSGRTVPAPSSGAAGPVRQGEPSQRM